MRRRSPAPVRGYSIPATPPYLCARCGHWLWFGSEWWEHRSASGRVVARVHRLCAREPVYPGSAVREVRHGTL